LLLARRRAVLAAAGRADERIRARARRLGEGVRLPRADRDEAREQAAVHAAQERAPGSTQEGVPELPLPARQIAHAPRTSCTRRLISPIPSKKVPNRS